jgi:hypothetical protein
MYNLIEDSEGNNLSINDKVIFLGKIFVIEKIIEHPFLRGEGFVVLNNDWIDSNKVRKVNDSI